MGYCVSIEITNVRISADKVAECLAAINAMHEASTLKGNAGGGSTVGDYWYSWVQNPPEGGFKSLTAAFDAWRYVALVNEVDGDVRLDFFQGEKWGDDEQLFEIIAPFINEGLIEVRGEDGARWRYEFEDGSMSRQDAITVWE